MAVQLQPAPRVQTTLEKPVVLIEPRQEHNWIMNIVYQIFDCISNLFGYTAQYRTEQEFKGEVDKLYTYHRRSSQNYKETQVVQKYLGLPSRMMTDSQVDQALTMDRDAYVQREMKAFSEWRVEQIQHHLEGWGIEYQEPVQAIRDELASQSPDWSKIAGQVERMNEIAASQGGTIEFVPFWELENLVNLDLGAIEQEFREYFDDVVQLNAQLTVKRLKPNELSLYERRALEVLTKTYESEDYEPTDVEMLRLTHFFEHIAGNLEFNQRLEKFSKEQENLRISQTAIDAALSLSFKLSRMEDLLRTAAKVTVLSCFLSSDLPTTKEERLSLREVRKVESLAKSKGDLEHLDRLGVVGSDSYQRMLLGARVADEFNEMVLAKAEKETPHRSGSFIAYDLTNSKEYLNWQSDWLTRCAFQHIFQSRIQHAATAVRGSDGRNMFSHMYRTHTYHRRSMGDYAFKTLEIDFDRIATEEGRAKLEKMYGEDWKDRVEELFEEIAFTIHTNTDNFKEVYNPPYKRILAAISFPFSPAPNGADRHQKLGKNLICSEFVLKTTIESILFLEDRLREDWNARGGEQLSDEHRFMTLPIREHRRLNRVLPHQMVQRAHQIVREVPKPSIIDQVMNYHDYDILQP